MSTSRQAVPNGGTVRGRAMTMAALPGRFPAGIRPWLAGFATAQ